MVETGAIIGIDRLLYFLFHELTIAMEEGLLRPPDCLFPISVLDNGMLCAYQFSNRSLETSIHDAQRCMEIGLEMSDIPNEKLFPVPIRCGGGSDDIAGCPAPFLTLIRHKGLRVCPTLHSASLPPVGYPVQSTNGRLGFATYVDRAVRTDCFATCRAASTAEMQFYHMTCMQSPQEVPVPVLHDVVHSAYNHKWEEKEVGASGSIAWQHAAAFCLPRRCCIEWECTHCMQPGS